MAKDRKKQKEVLPPSLLHSDFEVSAFSLSRALQRDLRTLSPVFVPASKAPIEEEKKEKKEKKEKNEKINLGDLIAVIVFQKSCVDLVEFGPSAQREKDRLLDEFMSYFHSMEKLITNEGFWCDAVDPCSGILVNSPRGGGIFSDLDFISSLVPYTFTQAGGCAVLAHPSWGCGVYPSLFFTNCPPSLLPSLLLKNQKSSENPQNN